MMQKSIIGNKTQFAIEYAFFDEEHATEIAIYLDGINVLAFERNGELLTTRWNMDDLALWLRNFVDNLSEDSYPVEVDGEFAAQKDDNARDFESDDDEIFEAYYQKLYNWNLRHRWHSASSGAILSDVFFQLVGDSVEISWDNRDVERGIRFESEKGGFRIPRKQFIFVVNDFLKAYAEHWF